MTRARVRKRDGAWRWDCVIPCPQGGAGYLTWRSALDAALTHLAAHNQFGLRRC